MPRGGNSGNRPGDAGMPGRVGGGGPVAGGTHTFPAGGRSFPYAYWPRYLYPSTYITTVRTTTMPFGLQGKGLLVGALVGFFLLPLIINAVRR